MAEKTTIARPYAEAVFEIAKAQKALPQWSEMLRLAAVVAADRHMRSMIGNPRVQKNQLVKLFLDICGDELNQAAQNLIRLLVENGRLGVLTEIAQLYEELRAEAERTLEAQVISAFPLDEAQKRQIAAALKQRMGREVTLICTADKNLLGGAIIRAGDLVIDGSVKGQLTKLGVALSR